MNQKSTNYSMILQKYDQYFEPLLKKFNTDLNSSIGYQKSSLNKKKQEQILSFQTLSKVLQNSIEEIGNENMSLQAVSKRLEKTNLLKYQRNSSKQAQSLKLEKILAKNITIKFGGNDSQNLNNNRACQKNNKWIKNVSPCKMFETSEYKFYLEQFNQKKHNQIQVHQKEGSLSKNTDTAFNIKSIKILNKMRESFKEQRTLSSKISADYKKRRYQKIINKQTQQQTQDQKENNLTKKTMKVLLSQLKKSQQFNFFLNQTSKCYQIVSNTKSSKKYLNTNQIIDLHQNLNLINTKQLNRSASLIINKKKNSTELASKLFSLNQDLTTSIIANNIKVFDKKIIAPKKVDVVFDQKIMKYFNSLKANAQILGVEINFPDSYCRNQFSFYVGKGNNSKLVKQTLKKRWWLGICEEKKDFVKNNVIWTQLKDKAYYALDDNIDETNKQNNKKLIIHNHFEQNEFLGNKKALFYNMKAYYQSINQNVFDYLPLTFHITSLSGQSWSQFLEYFDKIKQVCPEGKNIWILKPGQNSNRGNGITVHKSVYTIRSILSQDINSGRTYILQKYIQKPLLYNRRKFDIRCYMLLVRLNSSIKGFWYRQGYIRTSGYEFTLDDCSNTFIHLTNDAIQKNCDNYGKYQDKNKLSYDTFQKYLDSNFNLTNNHDGSKLYDFDKHILPKLKKVCLDSIKASYNCLGLYRPGLPTFELFGLDFMIDSDFNPWLIEINTNPCLQTEGRVLEKVIAPLLDNVFKLTIDCFIPPPLSWPNSSKHLISKSVDINNFQLVFDEKLQLSFKSKNEQSNRLPMDRIGQIDEDNQVYEEDEE